MTNQFCKTMALQALLVAVVSPSALNMAALAQYQPTVVLEIESVNCAQYQGDTTDFSKLATDPNRVAGATARNFAPYLIMCDIARVNGVPMKGTTIAPNMTINATAAPGQAIADITRNNALTITWEILQADGTPLGSIMGAGLGGGLNGPGLPLAATRGNFAITGGTGAFFGVRGAWGVSQAQQIASPIVSTTEDPANRRQRAGGQFRQILRLIPYAVPSVAATAGGPAITHANDFGLVTITRPAAAGEVLSLFATGLGPTTPGVRDGSAFPASPLQSTRSRIGVLVNGGAAPVVSAVGFPGSVDGYQVAFQVPPGTTRGVATVHLTVAGIVGPAIPVNIQ